MPLRADDRLQGRGLDVELHGEEAYGNGEGAILVLDVPRTATSRPAVGLGASGAIGARVGA